LFTFKLQRLLDVRIKLEETKKSEFLEAKKKLDDEIDKKTQLDLKKSNLICEVREMIETSNIRSGINDYNKYINYLKEQIVTIEKNIEVLKEVVNAKQKELVDAVKDRKIIEKMRERELEKYKKEELKIEENIVNEIVSYNYSVKKE